MFQHRRTGRVPGVSVRARHICLLRRQRHRRRQHVLAVGAGQLHRQTRSDGEKRGGAEAGLRKQRHAILGTLHDPDGNIPYRCSVRVLFRVQLSTTVGEQIFIGIEVSEYRTGRRAV